MKEKFVITSRNLQNFISIPEEKHEYFKIKMERYHSILSFISNNEEMHINYIADINSGLLFFEFMYTTFEGEVDMHEYLYVGSILKWGMNIHIFKSLKDGSKLHG